MGSLGDDVRVLTGPDFAAAEAALVTGGAAVGAARWEGADAVAAAGFVD